VFRHCGVVVASCRDIAGLPRLLMPAAILPPPFRFRHAAHADDTHVTIDAAIIFVGCRCRPLMRAPPSCCYAIAAAATLLLLLMLPMPLRQIRYAAMTMMPLPPPLDIS